MAKRMRRGKSIFSCCSSPRSSLRSLHPIFNCYEEDIWIEISKSLSGRCLVMLASVNSWFRRLILGEDSIWKYASLRDLQVPQPPRVNFSWIKLYASAFDGSHSYFFRQQEKHIDWMRIGAFYISSPTVLLAEGLSMPLKVPQGQTVETMLQTSGSCILTNLKTGVWIADLQLVRCPVCNLETCEGTMQTLDARHMELFLTEGYKNGSWEYQEIGSHEINNHTDGATGGIFDIKHLRDPSTAEVLNIKSWAAKPTDWQPKARIALYAVAVNTNLQPNDGLCIKYHAMRAGADGEVISIRISQQLL
ncbi:hypothetical protein IFM89_024419 [Coptis chinensis]|uniref:F-box protein n=1 Tax=Coptis chinensis TaxID=261450 RepID=A0A835HN90_9MAGN|nr:hypothetical protein IFM89_024419 [Coptis chinensis]